MQEREEIDKNEEIPSAFDKFLEKLEHWYKKFNLFSEIKEADSIFMMIAKVIVRIIGFLILLALSPFIILGLIIAFAAVL